MEIVFISFPFPGVSQVGEQGAKVGAWKFVRLDTDRVAIPPADAYILGAWIPQYRTVVNALEGKRLGVCWTSSIAETEMNAPIEMSYLRSICQDPRFSFIWFGDPVLAELCGPKGFHLAYPVAYESQPPAQKKDIVTLFCPRKPSKNIVNQTAAVLLAQRGGMDITLHTNAVEELNVDKQLKFVSHPWLPEREYMALLASSCVNLAATWSETMNYQAATSVLLGTPCVLAGQVPWFLSPGCMPSDPWSIRDAIVETCSSADRVLKKQRKSLESYSRRFHTQRLEELILRR